MLTRGARHRAGTPKFALPITAVESRNPVLGQMIPIASPSDVIPLPEAFKEQGRNRLPPVPDPKDDTLHLACYDIDPERVRKQLADGKAVGELGRARSVLSGTTPLTLVVRRSAKDKEADGKIAEISRMLLDAGAAIEGAEGEDPPLALACQLGDGISKPQTVQTLVDAGANLRARDREMLMTPLMWAVTSGYLDVVEILLRAGASATSKSGAMPQETVLEMAEKYVDMAAQGQPGTRLPRGDDEKAELKKELVAIRDLVKQAAEQRAAQKSVKSSSRLSKKKDKEGSRSSRNVTLS